MTANDGEITNNLEQQGHKHKHKSHNIQHHSSPANYTWSRNMEHERNRRKEATGGRNDVLKENPGNNSATKK